MIIGNAEVQEIMLNTNILLTILYYTYTFTYYGNYSTTNLAFIVMKSKILNEICGALKYQSIKHKY